MECTTANANNRTKPNSNISEIVSKFAKVSKLKCIGVFSEIPNLHYLHKHIYNDGPLGENSSEASEETKCYDEKIYPQSIEVKKKDDVCGNLEMMKFFNTVSALKLAYLEFQQTHIPYDPKKIIAADERVIAELEKLCEFKRVYKEKQSTEAKLNAAQYDIMRADVEAKETLLGKLKSQYNAKDPEILRLKKKLQDLEMVNEGLVAKIRRASLEKRKASILSVTKFHDAFKAASKSIHDFAKPVINLMKASGWDLNVAVESIANGVAYSKRSDKKYNFEAYVARRMFYEISLIPYSLDDVMKFDDPIDALMENPDSDLAKFCQTKYLLIIHPAMEESFFGNLDHRTFTSNGKHPRTEFYQLFTKMAKWVWILLGAAVSKDPNAAMFSVNRGSVFSNLYMESVEEEKGSLVLPNEQEAVYKVQFMVMPGFRIGLNFINFVLSVILFVPLLVKDYHLLLGGFLLACFPVVVLNISTGYKDPLFLY